MSDSPQSREAVAMKLAEHLLHADGKLLVGKAHEKAATRTEITVAFKEAVELVYHG